MIKREIPSSLDFEIINVEPINDFISDCEIKVFYTGKNRNGSYISKAVGNQIANSLPRTPIVAFYNEQIDDYEDHGEELIINRDGIKFIRKTVPFGAVSQTEPIVWKKFIDSNGTEREYLVCKGFLWTGRYPHLNKVLEDSKGQSMEFFPESIVGDWAFFENDNEEFFIFNEASISALCILGDDVEPCFEGASVGKPEILYSLKKNEFEREFANFMLELNKVLDKNSEEGGSAEVKIENKITDVEKDFVETQEETIEETTETEFTEETAEETVETEEVQTEEVTTDAEFEATEETTVETEEVVEEFTQEETIVEEEESSLENDFKLLEDKYEALNAEYELLKTNYDILVAEKQTAENYQKEQICEKFEVLGEEVITEFKANLNNYSVVELEEKLSAIAFKKGINFSVIASKENDIFTPSVQHEKTYQEMPEWLKAVDARVSSK